MTDRLICAGAGPPRGGLDAVIPAHQWQAVARFTPAFKLPRSAALVLAVSLLFLPSAQAVVCETCKDTIAGCAGGGNCPLLKAPAENSALLASGATSKAPDATKLLPVELLCTFTKSVMETLCAVARAPKGGGSVDLSSSSISTATGVVKAAINGFCTWEEAGLELRWSRRGRCTDSWRAWQQIWSKANRRVLARVMVREGLTRLLSARNGPVDLRRKGHFPWVTWAVGPLRAWKDFLQTTFVATC